MGILVLLSLLLILTVFGNKLRVAISILVISSSEEIISESIFLNEPILSSNFRYLIESICTYYASYASKSCQINGHYKAAECTNTLGRLLARGGNLLGSRQEEWFCQHNNFHQKELLG